MDAGGTAVPEDAVSGEPPERDDSPTSAQRELEERISASLRARLPGAVPVGRHVVIAVDSATRGAEVTAMIAGIRGGDTIMVVQVDDALRPDPDAVSAAVRRLSEDAFRAGYIVAHPDPRAAQAETLSVGYEIAKPSGPPTRIRPKRCLKCNAIVSADQQRCPMCGSRRVR